MKVIFSIILFFNFSSAFTQINWRDTTYYLPIRFIDTCRHLQNQTDSNLVSKHRTTEPLYIANGIVVRPDELNTEIIDSIFVLKCQESFQNFENLGINGVISIKTRQSFITTTPSLLLKNKKIPIKGKVSFALNGQYFTNLELPISLKAMKKIEITKSKDQQDLTIFNIWTLTKKEKKFIPSSACRGLKIIPEATSK